jgi:hypothetical protein
MREDPMLERLLSQHRAAAAGAPSADHPDVDTLARHVSGELSREKAQTVTSHLLACDDGRCIAFVRSQAEDGYATEDMLYPSDPDSPARTRTFQCKAGLWETFAEFAQQMGVPLDELIEEAMTEYARARGHLEAPTDRRRQPNVEASLEETRDAAAVVRSRLKPDPTELDDSDSMPAMGAKRKALRAPTPPPGTIRMPGRPGRPPQPVSAARAASMPPIPTAPMVSPAPPPAPARVRMSSGPVTGRQGPPPMPSAAPAPPPPAPGRAAPPALPGAPPMTTMKSATGRTTTPSLTLTYQGRPYVVDKDRYMIGRSKSGADLRLDDANVSRQHAMIERVGGAWYVVDLGSTNGVFVGGERVARRALRDGDLIEITTHHIRATLT